MNVNNAQMLHTWSARNKSGRIFGLAIADVADELPPVAQPGSYEAMIQQMQVATMQRSQPLTPKVRREVVFLEGKKDALGNLAWIVPNIDREAFQELITEAAHVAVGRQLEEMLR